MRHVMKERPPKYRLALFCCLNSNAICYSISIGISNGIDIGISSDIDIGIGNT